MSTINKETIIKLKEKVSEATAISTNGTINVDELYPAPKGKKKTSTLMGELDEIVRKANAKMIQIEEVPEIKNQLEKICEELSERMQKENMESGKYKDLISLEKEINETFSTLESEINQSLSRFI